MTAPFGTRIGVRVSDESFVERLVRELLPSDWPLEEEPESDVLYSLKVGGQGKRRGVRNYHLLYAGGVRVARTLDLEELLADLREGIHDTVAATADSRTFLAGGAVEWKGRVILLPGPRGNGCSTLAAALVEQGAQPFSDRFVVLDQEGQAHPYQVKGREQLSPTPASLVVMTEYSDKVKSFRPRTLSPGQAAMHMFSHSFSARRRPDRDLPLLSKLAVRTPVLKARRGEAEAAAKTILRKAERL